MHTRELAWAITASVVLGLPAVGAAQGWIEGTVVGTKLTAGDFKPGSCEGTLVLDTGGTRGRVTITVPRGTQITRGSDHLFLPGLKGRRVRIAYQRDRGNWIAGSIEVSAATP